MSTSITFDYFYGGESEQFSYYRIPRILITGAEFKGLSTDAKLLYGLLLNRMGLSVKNHWFDERGRAYIYYRLDEVQESLDCSHEKAGKLLGELDDKKGIGLIERVRQGQGKPTIIYVKHFARPKIGGSDFRKPDAKTSENRKSRHRKNGSADFGFSDGSYNKSNRPYTNQPKSSIPKDAARMDRHDCRERVKESVGYVSLIERHSLEEIDGVVELICDVVSSTQDTLRIGGELIPAAEVKARFEELDFTHIEYVLECMSAVTTEIRNVRGYLLTALYHAPLTIEHYYAAQVQHDFGKGEMRSKSGHFLRTKG